MDDLSLPGIDKAVVETLTARMEQLKGDISQAINTMGLRATGATQRSLHVEVTSNEVALWGRKFFASLEYGSRPWTGASGIRCTIADFKAIIDAWASAKGLNFGQHKDHERAISAIAMTIIRKGSRLFRSHAYVDVYDTLIRNAMRDFDTIAVDKVGTQLDIAINRWTRRSIDINYL